MNQFGYTVSMTDPHTLIIEVDKEGEQTMGELTIQHQGGTLKMDNFAIITDPEADPGFEIHGKVIIGRPDFVAAETSDHSYTYGLCALQRDGDTFSTVDLPPINAIFENNEEAKQ